MTALLADLWPYLAGLGALLLTVLGIYRRGRVDQRRETALEAAERAAKTRERMDDAEAAFGDDPAAARRLMHERDRNRR